MVCNDRGMLEVGLALNENKGYLASSFLDGPWWRGSFLLSPPILSFPFIFNSKRVMCSRNSPAVVSDASTGNSSIYSTYIQEMSLQKINSQSARVQTR